MKNLLFIFVVLLIASCSQTNTDVSVSEDALYRNSLSLIRQYEVKMKAAADSAEADSLMTRFSAQMDSVNFAFPPETYLKLTEGQNDTLTMVTNRMLSIYRKKLTKQLPDTTSTI